MFGGHLMKSSLRLSLVLMFIISVQIEARVTFPGYYFSCVINEPWFLLSVLLLQSQFSRSVVSDSLRPHELQRTRPPCPSPTPGVHSNSCPLNRWCHSTILSSVVPFSCLQSFPASGSFQMSQFFTSSGQSIGVSASASVLPMNIQDWFPLDGLIGSPCSPRDYQESSPTPQFKSISSSVLSLFYDTALTSIHDWLALNPQSLLSSLFYLNSITKVQINLVPDHSSSNIPCHSAFVFICLSPHFGMSLSTSCVSIWLMHHGLNEKSLPAWGLWWSLWSDTFLF